MAKRKGESFVLDFSGDELKAQTFEEVVKERDAIAAALREAREDTKRLDEIIRRSVAKAWDDELGYSVALETREMVDAWIAWDDAAMKPPGGEQ